MQGAGGVIVPPRTYFEKIQAVLKKHDVLFIADEVICGFGRTGNMFGSETYGIRPDIMTMAKALSSAYQPISAVMIIGEDLSGLRPESDKIGMFGHGYTYSGHPVCGRGRARDAEDLRGARHRRPCPRRRARFLKALHDFAGHPLVGEVRGIGLMAAVELVQGQGDEGAVRPEASRSARPSWPMPRSTVS